MDVNGIKRTTCSTAGPLFVTEKDGKVLRVEPMYYDPEEVTSWSVKSSGKEYRPPLTHPVLHWGLGSGYAANAESRVGYPLKRVDWDPSGERNPQNRGISGYERITWDEAFGIMESEITRVIETYGNSALARTNSGHPEWGSLHYYFSAWTRFWDMVGSTVLEYSPVSWEGWAGGATFVWGYWAAMGFPTASDSLQDITEHSDTIVIWGVEPLFHNAYTGIDEARIWQYWRDLGKKIIVIEPLCNETANAYADKWIPIKSGTDAAMALAILNVWIKDSTFDKDYLDTHCIGWDDAHLPEGVPAGQSMEAYVMGKADDGVEKTPEWAAAICGVSASVIRTLAREWAAGRTSFWVMGGGACRRTYGHEFPRLAAVLSLAQGIGKPGVNIIGGFLSLSGPMDAMRQVGPMGYADGGMNGVLNGYKLNTVNQTIQAQWLYDCIKNPPQKWHGGRTFNVNADEWLQPYEYPAPGCSEIHLIAQCGSSLVNAPRRYKRLEALRDPKIETFIVMAPWFDRDCRIADLVLPAATLYERNDISEPASVGVYVPAACIGLRTAVYHQKVGEPYGESMTELDMLTKLAERLGIGEMFTEGCDEEDYLKGIYAKTNIPLSYEEFKEKGYYVWPEMKDYQPCKQLQPFYDDPDNNPLETPTGKAEIFSTRLWQEYGCNEEIPPVPHYIPETEGVASGEILEKYPLQMLMSHPKFRFHGKYSDSEWLKSYYKVFGPDGYPYEPVRMNPVDAAARGLKEGDIVRCYNDRGQMLCGVHITNRIVQGVADVSYGSWNDPLDGTDMPLDRSGDSNILAYDGPMSVHHVAGAFNTNLFEIEKVDLDELRERYPEGFAGKFTTWNKGR